jgi:hypothetical protein
MSQREREARSRANQLLRGAGLLHGYLSTRFQTCGKKTCRCARGEKHRAFVLVIREKGETTQIPVPKDLEPTVRLWVEQDRELRDLLKEISDFHRDRVLDLKEKRRKE